MKYFILTLFILLFSFSVFSQSDSIGLQTAELLSPMDLEGKPYPISARKSCFSFISGSHTVGTYCDNSDIYYGSLRTGDNWDWFQTMGVGSRNKIKNLGELDWTDDFKIPVVEPYSKLKEGEQRNIVVDTSGEDGKPGKQGLPGKNADGTYNSIPEDSNQTTTDKAKKTREKVKSDYQPYEKAVLGNMYVIRVVDETNDFYVLFRVEELERGKRCKISWKRIDAPNEDDFNRLKSTERDFNL